MKLPALAVLACAGCITDSEAAYPVDAIAQLAPVTADPPRVAGPIEFLATGMPSGVADAGTRTVAAYHVQLPADLAAAVFLVNAASCIDREPLSSPDYPVATQYVGLLQRVGDQTHFFAESVRVDDHVVTVDTGTAVAYTSPGAPFPQIVLAVDRDDFRLLACGEVTWR